MAPGEPSDPIERFPPQLRVSGILLVVLVVLGTVASILRVPAQLLASGGFLWFLDLSLAPGGGTLHVVIGLLLGIIMLIGRLPLAGGTALLAGLWGLFLVTGWFSFLAFPFAYFGGLGFSVLAAVYFPRGPALFQGVAFPAMVLLVGSRAILVGPLASALIAREIKTQQYERSKPAEPERVRCDDALNWLCTPGADLDVSGDGSIAVLSTDGTVGLWDPKAKKQWTQSGTALADAAYSMLRFTPDGAHLLCVTGAGARLLDSATGENVAELDLPTAGNPGAWAFALLEHEIVAAGPAWAFYDDRTGAIGKTTKSACGAAQAVAPGSKAGRYWAACGQRVLLWDSDTGEERIVETLVPESQVLSLGGATSDGTILAHVILPGAAGGLWRFSEDPAMASIELPVREKRPLRRRQSLRFDSQGRVAFPSGNSGRIVDAATGSAVWNHDGTAPVRATAWGADGRSLLFLGSERKGSTKGFVRRWQLARD